MNKYIDIITSPRFVQMFFIGVAVGLQSYQSSGSWITAVTATIMTWFGGSVAVGTIDKFSKSKESETTVSIPSDVSSVTAKTKKK